VARRKLGFWRRFAVTLVIPPMGVWTRPTWSGQENIPPTGGVILVANHISHFDPLVVAHYVYESGRWPRFLTKASMWKVPLVGPFLTKALQIPVERGSVEAVKSLDVLVDAVREGGAVMIYPEGTTTKEPDLWPMRGKTGAARLALATGAPVVPIATWGAERVFDPRTGKFKLRLHTPVSVIAGKPIDLSQWAGDAESPPKPGLSVGGAPSRDTLDQMTDQIMLVLRDLVAEIREGTPPPLYEPPARKKNPPAVSE
jgi:1-acyl-sn-glycerol-3-phosphate acyltransferase